VDKNKSRLLNVLHLDKPDPHYLCACQVPAHWYIRTVPITEARPDAEREPHWDES
jgi:hypothetical protein